MLHGTIGFVMIVWLSGQSEKPQQFRWQKLRCPSRKVRLPKTINSIDSRSTQY